MDALLARLRRLRPAADPDGPLLARYAATGDEAAFAELVRRHGPLVWAAARRRLPDPADAADVFQATFLVLARKGPRLAGHPTVGPWLYRVAALTARNLRRRNAVRAAVPASPDLPARPEPDPSLRWDLDDALLALGERDRAAVVLCHLQGYTRREAAERLGLPEGTLSAVLHRALKKLRTRLGDPLPVLAAAAAAAVPAGVATAACQSVAAFRVAALSGVAAPGVVRLTRETLRMFWLKKLVAGGMAAAACLGLGAGVGLAPRPAAVAAGDSPKAEPPAKPLDEWAELNKKLGELIDANQAQLQRSKAESERLQNEMTKVRRQMADWEAARPGPPRLAGPHLLVTVQPAAGMGGPAVRVREFDAAGKELGEWGASTRDALRLLLRRTTLDPLGPRQLVLYIDGGFNDPQPILDAAADVAGYGFPTVTYTGPLPEKWSVGANQDGKPVRTWTGTRQAAGERVELAKVLPIDPPAAPPAALRFYVIVDNAGSEVVTTLPFTGSGDTVLDVIAALSLPVNGTDANVWVARTTAGRPEEVLPVDWTGITRKGDSRTNYLLRPGDRVYVRPGRPAK
jgi:RNA polymerase sigma factor (sigma-70 family)